MQPIQRRNFMSVFERNFRHINVQKTPILAIVVESVKLAVRPDDFPNGTWSTVQKKTVLNAILEMNQGDCQETGSSETEFS